MSCVCAKTSRKASVGGPVSKGDLSRSSGHTAPSVVGSAHRALGRAEIRSDSRAVK